MTHSSAIWAEIDLTQLRQNARALQARVQPAELMAVVKANAYGHGLREIVSCLANEGIRWFGIARLEEAAIARQAAPDAEIVCLLPLTHDQLAEAVALRAVVTVSDHETALALFQEAALQNVIVQVHVEIDTGMGRSGVLPDGFAALIQMIAQFPHLELKGVMTHLSSAESDAVRSFAQLSDFDTLLANLEDTADSLVGHASNSAALSIYAAGHYNFVRAGIALYGVSPGGEANKSMPGLEPVLSLKARILSVRDLPVGHSVSYGATYTCHAPSRIATIAVGYADGYSRALSNSASVLINGKRAPIVGAICMDALMVNVTHIPGVAAGDTATLIGRDGDEEITVPELAAIVETTPHEILTSLGQRIRRVYLDKAD